ncbi:MAG TPA: hypothetical protein PKL83_06315, partial [bacterium]|nr:hypothetical protein [bacterium]
QQRQIDLHTIKEGLQKYYAQNSNLYPVLLEVDINGTDDPLTQILVPLYLDDMPGQEESGSQSYYYSSLSGKSFILKAMLSDGSMYSINETEESN